MSQGKLIVFEGDDAAGKRTQSERLTKRLNAVLYSFPVYETDTGQAIRSNLSSQDKWLPASWRKGDQLKHGEWEPVHGQLDALVRQSLFAVNRHEHAGAIAKHLEGGRNVVCDRYWASGYVFGQCDGLDSGWLIRIHEMLPQPDVWLLLDIPPEESIKRRPERRDRYETDGRAVQRRQLYLKLFNERTSNMHKGACYSAMENAKACHIDPRCTCDVRAWHTINGLGTVEEVEQRIWDAVNH